MVNVCLFNRYCPKRTDFVLISDYQMLNGIIFVISYYFVINFINKLFYVYACIINFCMEDKELMHQLPM